MLRLPDDFIYPDYRGQLRVVHFDLLKGVPFKPVQMLVVNNHAGVFRGMHYQTVKPMCKAVFCVQGMIRDFAIDRRTGGVRQEVLTPDTNGVVVEAHEAHGYYSPGESTVIYFYDKPYLPDKQAGYAAAQIFRHFGISAVLSEQDAQWPEFALSPDPRK